MRAWRLTRAAYASDPLSGRGAIAGNRWNCPNAHRVCRDKPRLAARRCWFT
jgi:RES domain-containing protein